MNFDNRNFGDLDSYSQKLYYANSLKKLCEMRRVTISQLALLSGLDEAHIDKIWNAEIKPSHAVLGKIAVAFGIPLENLFVS